MPSTTGENAIPSAFAGRQARDFGGTVVDQVGHALASLEAKKRRTFSQKLVDPTRFEIFQDLNVNLRRPCVIVDDVFSSGDSLVALRRDLGMNLPLLVLAGGPAEAIEADRIDSAAKRLAELGSADYAEVRRLLSAKLQGAYAAMVDALDKEVDAEPGAATQIVELLARGASTVPPDAG